MRLFGLAVLLAALSACADQAPRSIVPTVPTHMVAAVSPQTASLQPIAPRGYCLSDEADALGFKLRQQFLDQPTESNRLLGIFRPCDEPIVRRGAPAINADRLAFLASPMPSSPADELDTDRQLFLAMMANPKVTAVLSERIIPPAREKYAGRPGRMTLSDLRYLGADADAVYNGGIISYTGPADGPAQRVQGDLRLVMGMTVVGQELLTVFVVNLSIRGTPKDWKALQATAAEAIRGTIAAAERRAPRTPAPTAAPPRGSGVST
ncbi:hypothetical protein [Inquilinus limosus]|uniref:hypothetical protein n=1 Tax=Inquilinus limosus TaxID=171674 RepID=UPI00047B1E30|nr:hypothetical protein [Inquilinus limosus]